MFFFLLGAWPVVGFLGLDVLLVYWAFRANYRAAAAFEEVTVTPSELRLRRVSHRGEVARMDAQPALDQARPRDARGVRAAAAVPGVARAQACGRGLPRRRKERESFAAALSAALGEARRGPTRTRSSRVRNRVGWPRLGGLDGEQHDGDRHALARPHVRPRAAVRPPPPTTTSCAAPSPTSAATGATQPEIEEIAEAAGVTPTELHHLFRRWAGLTPKAFLQALTLDSARKLLRDSASVLDASYEVGLSGPGRLHDLFVTHEAMSPGEWKSGGEGLTISYGFHPRRSAPRW